VIPVIIIAIIGAVVFYELPGITGPPAQAAPTPTIRVDAHQFYWQFIYPNGARSIDVMHLPVGRSVRIAIGTQDVNHSWWIPELGGKTDAIAGRINRTWYKPDSVGSYIGQCVELCGVFHERMLSRAIVEDESAYDAFTRTGWRQSLGRSEWQGVCAKCHGAAGQGDYGPAISSNPLLIHEAALTQLLRNGRGRMPAVGNNWTRQQIQSLVRYVKANIYKGAASGG
jgi:cytochrome c oxidase subunit 2